MKLFFDARYIRTDFHDGISRYTTELGNALARLIPVTFIICDQKQLDFLPGQADHVIIHSPTSVKEPLTAKILNTFHPDVVFSPMQTMGAQGRTFKLILTLHDMIYYRHRTPPRHLKPHIRTGWWLYHATYHPQRFTLNQADIIATVSNASRQDILDARLTKRPVVVIPNAPNDLGKYLDHDVTPTAAPQNLIYMGSFMKYKNVETLIAGMEFLPGRTLHLLSRIAPRRRQELERHVPNGTCVVFHNGVSDKEYAELLTRNAVLVTASKDEGYNLPLAEALQLGIPVVASDLAIHREVAGEGALYFEAANPQVFAERVTALDDPRIVTRLTTAGTQHIATFSWERSARILLDTCKSLQ